MTVNVYALSTVWQEDQSRPRASSVRQAIENQSQIDRPWKVKVRWPWWCGQGFCITCCM